MLVMRDDDGARGEFAQQVERVVQRRLSELAFMVSASPLPFRDAQLAAGCSGSVRECGAPVAAALDSEELLVSRVEDEPGQRQATLTLLRFAPRTPPRAGTAQLPRAPLEERSAAVRALVESMFSDRTARSAPLLAPPANVSASSALEPLPESDPSAQLAPASASAPESDYVQRIAHAEQRRRLLAVGWPTLVVGAGLLVGGIVANASAQREGRAYRSLMADSPAEIDAKIAHRHNAEGSMTAARVLFGVGGALATAGVFVLLWERFGPSPDRKLQKLQTARRGDSHVLRFAAAPSVNGFALGCAGEL